MNINEMFATALLNILLRHRIVGAGPNGLDKTSADRWITVLETNDDTDNVRRAAAEIIKCQKRSADKTCTI